MIISFEETMPMNQIMTYIIPVVLAAVTIVLFLGLWNMMRGDKPSLSQKLMRWRVGLQFIAVIVIMAGLYFSVKF
jgi:Hypoxia induced protein conserved region